MSVIPSEAPGTGREGFLLAAFPSLAKATQQLEEADLPDGNRSTTNHIGSAFYLWDLSPTSLLLGQDGCLEAVKATEGTETISRTYAATQH